mgnify:CR=1 FL=1
MRKYILLYTGLLLSVSGCSLLELDESTGLDREEAYSYFSNVKGLATYVYSQLPGDLGVLDGALRESATDNSVYVWSDNSVHDFYNNAWSPNNAVDNMWSKCYGAIRSVNSFLENYSQEKLERFRWNDTYEEDIAKATMYREELRVLRAFYLFELAKRYGDIPLLTRTYALDEINGVEKTSFNEVIKYICDECSDAAKTLPVSHQDFWAETGADAAYAIIKENWYSLPKTNVDPLYDKNGGNDVLKSPQLIFERRNGESFDFEANNLPISYEKGKTGNVPTQNLVDAFQMTNGKDFDWEQITPGQNPYEGRDQKKPHHFIIFRYAEILLNYAEAMDAWKDADYTDNDHPLSARAALNQVRAAAKAIYCIKITMENGLPVYKKELLETRNWDDKMYLYPIPQTEYYKNPNLGQNTGW